MSSHYFLHLSDLHLPSSLPAGLEGEEGDIRDQVVDEVAKWRDTHKRGSVAGILVTGDIAGTGQAEEFQHARNWFRKLTETAGCDVSRVFVVPGNHDVNRTAITDDLKVLHSEVRDLPSPEVEKRLKALLSGEPTASLLLSPLDNYREFADSYLCGITADQLAWTQVLPDLPIRIVGLTTALISDSEDVRGHKGLILGGWQSVVPADSSRVTMVLMHHPPEWLHDRERTDQKLRRRASIVLSGHQHAFDAMKIEPLNTAPYLRVMSGALHPDRSEPDWDPRFNWIEIEIGGAESEASHIRIFPYKWDESDGMFHPERGRTHETLDLNVTLSRPAGAIRRVGHRSGGVQTTDQGEVGKEAKKGESSYNVEKTMDKTADTDPRAVYYRYRELPVVNRVKLLRKLNLTVDQQTQSGELEGIRRTLLEVSDRKQTAEFIKAVLDAYDEAFT